MLSLDVARLVGKRPRVNRRPNVTYSNPLVSYVRYQCGSCESTWTYPGVGTYTNHCKGCDAIFSDIPLICASGSCIVFTG